MKWLTLRQLVLGLEDGKIKNVIQGPLPKPLHCVAELFLANSLRMVSTMNGAASQMSG